MFTWVLKFILDVFFALYPQPIPARESLQNLLVIAHRGVHENKVAKENTIKSFDLAREKKLWGIEFDIQWTQDNTPVIHHDENTNRVFNKSIQIKKTDFHELRSAIPEIPTLNEVLQRYKGDLHFMIELKTQLTTEQNAVLSQLLSEFKPGVDYHLLSLNPLHFKMLTDFPENCFVLVATFDVKEKSQQAINGRFSGLAGHYYLLNADYLSRHQGAQQKVGVGYINSKNSLYREANRGANWLFTDKAVTLSNILHSLPM